MGQAIVETKNLTKTYDGFTAVDGLNLRIEEGETFGFLGPNGAGKSTTILMLLGLTEPSSGTAQASSYPTVRARAWCSTMPVAGATWASHRAG